MSHLFDEVADFGNFVVNSTGDIAVTGLPFQPSRVKFSAAVPADAATTEFAGTTNGDTEDNFAGVMIGYAKDDDGTTTEQVAASGISGNSVNGIRVFASASACIGVSYGDQNGAEIAQITGTLKSWDITGFTVNIGTYSSVANVSGLLVLWEAYR